MKPWVRAFIAAPLLGTLIFATSVLFSVNLSRTDNTEVAAIVSDAFHNRIVALLDVYRSDLGSLFRTALTRNIEFFLSSPGWMTGAFALPFTDTPYIDPTKGTNSGRKGRSTGCDASDFVCQRIEGCGFMTELIHESVCPANREYGISKWLTIVGQNRTFEGISFSAANPASFAEFQGPQGPDLCRLLVQGSMFDCNSFGPSPSSGLSSPVLRCFDPETKEVLPGCENGTFYVKIKATDPQIFPKLPRVVATDGAGNIIRSGAISDEDFYLPITYPFYLYFDLSLKFYEKLHDVLEAPAGGYCVAVTSGGQCDKITGGPYRSNGTSVGNTPEGARTALATIIYRDAIVPACDVISKGQFGNVIKVELFTEKPLTSNEGYSDCYADSQEIISFIAERLTYPVACAASGGSGEDCVVFNQFGGAGMQVRLIDSRPAFQVDPNRPNRYAFQADPQYGTGKH